MNACTHRLRVAPPPGTMHTNAKMDTAPNEWMVCSEILQPRAGAGLGGVSAPKEPPKAVPVQQLKVSLYHEFRAFGPEGEVVDG